MTYVHHGKNDVPADARVSVIHAGEITDKEDLLSAVGDALGFPDYVGGNWDAFEEAFRDMAEEFGQSGRLVVEIDGSGQLQDRLGSELETLAEIWEDNAEDLASEGLEAHLVLA